MFDLYCDDCLNILPTIETGSIDLICCDLPYGVTANKADIVIPFADLWREYERVIKDNGAIVLFGQGMFTAQVMMSNPKWWRYNLVWDKELTTGFLNAHRMPLRSHEDIMVFYNKLPTYNPQMTEGKPLHGRGNAYKSKDNTNRTYGDFEPTEDVRKGSTEKFPKSVLHFPKPHPSTVLHSAQKPVPLLEWLIKTYTNEGIGCLTVVWV